MGMLICNRCEAYKDSHDGDTVVDPTDDSEMICETCLTDEELEALNPTPATELVEEINIECRSRIMQITNERQRIQNRLDSDAPEKINLALNLIEIDKDLKFHREVLSALSASNNGELMAEKILHNTTKKLLEDAITGKWDGNKVVISRECAEFNLDQSIKSKKHCPYPNGQARWERNTNELQQALQEQE